MTKIVIKTELLDAIARFAYPYQDRAISRVAFRNEQIIATDGHRIVIADFKLHGQSFAIERRHLLAAVAACLVHTWSGVSAAQDGESKPALRSEERGGPPPQHEHPRRPPPETFSACEGKQAGAECTVTFRERTIEGVCVAPDKEELFCMPNDMPPPRD